MMSKVRMLLIGLAATVAFGAATASAGLFSCDDCRCYEWCYRKYGGGYGNCGNYCSPYQGWFGSPYYGGLNCRKWNSRGWGYDGVGAH